MGRRLGIVAGTLDVTFVNGYPPKAGDVIARIDGAAAAVKSTTVTVHRFKATPASTATGVSILLSAA
ncbi:hypothetical protein I6G79_26600 [Burkholderia plantarii]|nr:hypothetical protein [Burkholderia plantarii]